MKFCSRAGDRITYVNLSRFDSFLARFSKMDKKVFFAGWLGHILISDT